MVRGNERRRYFFYQKFYVMFWFVEEEEDSFVSLVKRMAIEEKINLSCAKVLITAYKKEKRSSD